MSDSQNASSPSGSICTYTGRHGTGVDLGYGTRAGVQYVKCLLCGEEIGLQLSAEDVAMLREARSEENDA